MKQKRDRLNDESRLSRFTTHVVLIFASFLAFGPFVWMFLTSIKTYEETIQIPMKFLPEIPQWVNFSIVSDKLNFPQLYLNTILVTIMMIVGQILIVTICAYAFDRLNFPGKNVLFMGMLALMMVPGQIFIIPRFKLMVNLGLTNTLVGLVLPGLFNIFGVFLMRQFFSTLPRELDEAARIDGAGQRQILFGITIPMVKDSIGLVVMLQMIASFKLFGQTYLMSGGGPGTSTRTIVHYIYETGFTNRHMGSAAAMSVAFFAVVLAASLIQNRIFAKEG